MKSCKEIIYIFIITFFLSGIFVCLNNSAFASSTDGTIDSAYRYAWGENIGWIDFGAASGNVHITDSGLSGSALSENIGWINLDNVDNDGAGNLSGYGWGENAGWIKFNPDNGGVKINSSGEFTGSAWGENIGWIIFGGDYKVKTDWRPRSARPVCNNAADDDADGKIDYPADPGCSSLDDTNETEGGGVPFGAFSAPASPSPTTENPEGKFNVTINNGGDYTNSVAATLKFVAGFDTTKMAVSNYSDFHNAAQEPYQETKKWILPKGEGIKIVYVKFYTQYGQSSPVVSDRIILDTLVPEIKITESKDYYNDAEDVILIGATEAKAEIILAWDKKYGLIHANEQGKLTINLGKMPAGEYQLKLTPTDLAGNRGNILIVNLIIKSVVEVFAKAPEAIAEAPISSEQELEKPIYPKPVEQIIEKAREILDPLIPEFLKPEEKKEEKPEEIIIIPQETPLSMRGQWKLLPEESIRIFVLAPLPREIRELAKKIPELGKTLEKIGVTKITDVEKLKTVKLMLPGLTEIAGLPAAKFEPGKFSLPIGMPISKLSPQAKQQLPSEIVFAKTGGELIDFNIVLSVGEKGELQQKISTISNKPLQLVVKPDQPVKSVKGYVVFKSKTPRPTSFQFPFNFLTASLIFAKPVFARPVRNNESLVFVEGAKPQSRFSRILASLVGVSNGVKSQEQPVRVEEKLVLLEFEYIDPDGDGIYTAEIQTPVIDGEYEIITVMEFVSDPTVVDPEGRPLEIKKEIRLIVVVDPEGYVYERDGDKETRIPGAIISLFWLNPETKQYELWPAKVYQQENPQTTDIRGTYSFLVPEGFYYLKAETPGYLIYDGKPFQVKEGSGIHINIELKTKYQWLKIIDWKTFLLILVVILLFYNFYRDKISEKLSSRRFK